MRKFDPDKIAHELSEAGKEWAEAEATASQLEELKKVVLAQLKTQSGEKSEAAKETEALASEEYKTHIVGMVEARRVANIKKARYLTAKTWAELKRTEQSNRRAEMGLT